MKSQYYSPKVAMEYGITAAILAHYLLSMSISNAREGSFHMDGCYWARISYAKLHKALPYFSKHTISHALRKLVNDGVLVRAQFSKKEMNFSYWYAFTAYGFTLLARGDEDELEKNVREL